MSTKTPKTQDKGTKAPFNGTKTSGPIDLFNVQEFSFTFLISLVTHPPNHPLHDVIDVMVSDQIRRFYPHHSFRDPLQTKYPFPTTFLIIASAYGFVKVVEALLLSPYIDVNYCVLGHTPLHAALCLFSDSYAYQFNSFLIDMLFNERTGDELYPLMWATIQSRMKKRPHTSPPSLKNLSFYTIPRPPTENHEIIFTMLLKSGACVPCTPIQRTISNFLYTIQHIPMKQELIHYITTIFKHFSSHDTRLSYSAFDLPNSTYHLDFVPQSALCYETILPLINRSRQINSPTGNLGQYARMKQHLDIPLQSIPDYFIWPRWDNMPPLTFSHYQLVRQHPLLSTDDGYEENQLYFTYFDYLFAELGSLNANPLVIRYYINLMINLKFISLSMLAQHLLFLFHRYYITVTPLFFKKDSNILLYIISRYITIIKSLPPRVQPTFSSIYRLLNLHQEKYYPIPEPPIYGESPRITHINPGKISNTRNALTVLDRRSDIRSLYTIMQQNVIDLDENQIIRKVLQDMSTGECYIDKIPPEYIPKIYHPMYEEDDSIIPHFQRSHYRRTTTSSFQTRLLMSFHDTHMDTDIDFRPYRLPSLDVVYEDRTNVAYSEYYVELYTYISQHLPMHSIELRELIWLIPQVITQRCICSSTKCLIIGNCIIYRCQRLADVYLPHATPNDNRSLDNMHCYPYVFQKSLYQFMLSYVSRHDQKALFQLAFSPFIGDRLYNESTLGLQPYYLHIAAHLLAGAIRNPYIMGSSFYTIFCGIVIPLMTRTRVKYVSDLLLLTIEILSDQPSFKQKHGEIKTEQIIWFYVILQGHASNDFPRGSPVYCRHLIPESITTYMDTGMQSVCIDDLIKCKFTDEGGDLISFEFRKDTRAHLYSLRPTSKMRHERVDPAVRSGLTEFAIYIDDNQRDLPSHDITPRFAYIFIKAVLNNHAFVDFCCFENNQNVSAPLPFFQQLTDVLTQSDEIMMEYGIPLLKCFWDHVDTPSPSIDTPTPFLYTPLANCIFKMITKILIWFQSSQYPTINTTTTTATTTATATIQVSSKSSRLHKIGITNDNVQKLLVWFLSSFTEGNAEDDYFGMSHQLVLEPIHDLKHILKAGNINHIHININRLTLHVSPYSIRECYGQTGWNMILSHILPIRVDFIDDHHNVLFPGHALDQAIILGSLYDDSPTKIRKQPFSCEWIASCVSTINRMVAIAKSKKRKQEQDKAAAIAAAAAATLKQQNHQSSDTKKKAKKRMRVKRFIDDDLRHLVKICIKNKAKPPIKLKIQSKKIIIIDDTNTKHTSDPKHASNKVKSRQGSTLRQKRKGKKKVKPKKDEWLSWTKSPCPAKLVAIKQFKKYFHKIDKVYGPNTADIIPMIPPTHIPAVIKTICMSKQWNDWWLLFKSFIHFNTIDLYSTFTEIGHASSFVLLTPSHPGRPNTKHHENNQNNCDQTDQGNTNGDDHSHNINDDNNDDGYIDDIERTTRASPYDVLYLFFHYYLSYDAINTPIDRRHMASDNIYFTLSNILVIIYQKHIKNRMENDQRALQFVFNFERLLTLVITPIADCLYPPSYSFCLLVKIIKVLYHDQSLMVIRNIRSIIDTTCRYRDIVHKLCQIKTRKTPLYPPLGLSPFYRALTQSNRDTDATLMVRGRNPSSSVTTRPKRVINIIYSQFLEYIITNAHSVEQYHPSIVYLFSECSTYVYYASMRIIIILLTMGFPPVRFYTASDEMAKLMKRMNVPHDIPTDASVACPQYLPRFTQTLFHGIFRHLYLRSDIKVPRSDGVYCEWDSKQQRFDVVEFEYDDCFAASIGKLANSIIKTFSQNYLAQYAYGNIIPTFIFYMLKAIYRPLKQPLIDFNVQICAPPPSIFTNGLPPPSTKIVHSIHPFDSIAGKQINFAWNGLFPNILSALASHPNEDVRKALFPLDKLSDVDLHKYQSTSLSQYLESIKGHYRVNWKSASRALSYSPIFPRDLLTWAIQRKNNENIDWSVLPHHHQPCVWIPTMSTQNGIIWYLLNHVASPSLDDIITLYEITFIDNNHYLPKKSKSVQRRVPLIDPDSVNSHGESILMRAMLRGWPDDVLIFIYQQTSTTILDISDELNFSLGDYFMFTFSQLLAPKFYSMFSPFHRSSNHVSHFTNTGYYNSNN